MAVYVTNEFLPQRLSYEQIQQFSLLYEKRLIFSHRSSLRVYKKFVKIRGKMTFSSIGIFTKKLAFSHRAAGIVGTNTASLHYSSTLSPNIKNDSQTKIGCRKRFGLQKNRASGNRAQVECPIFYATQYAISEEDSLLLPKAHGDSFV